MELTENQVPGKIPKSLEAGTESRCCIMVVGTKDSMQGNPRSHHISVETQYPSSSLKPMQVLVALGTDAHVA